jgi:polyphenol oxidase
VPVDVQLTLRRRGQLAVHVFDDAAALGVDAFVTGRGGGVSDAPYDSLNLGDHVGDDPDRVKENRRRVADAAGVAELVTGRQVHGDHVALVDAHTVEVTADGLVTQVPNLALAILIADCVPILVVDPAPLRIGVVHAGWRGLASDVLAHAVEHFDSSATLRVFIGPAISPATYQVGPEVAEHFRDVPGALHPDDGDRSRLDLRLVAVARLNKLGVPDGQIHVAREVTDGGSVFFSDRAQRPCGRFALVAKARSMSSS